MGERVFVKVCRVMTVPRCRDDEHYAEISPYSMTITGPGCWTTNLYGLRISSLHHQVQRRACWWYFCLSGHRTALWLNISNVSNIHNRQQTRSSDSVSKVRKPFRMPIQEMLSTVISTSRNCVLTKTWTHGFVTFKGYWKGLMALSTSMVARRRTLSQLCLAKFLWCHATRCFTEEMIQKMR